MPRFLRSSAAWPRSSRTIMLSPPFLGCALATRLPDSGQLLEQLPVFEAFLFGRQERGRWISVLVEVFREPAFGAGEGDEIDRLSSFRIHVPVILNVRVAHQTQALLEPRSLARIVDEYREAARIGRQLGLVLRHVIAHAVLGLARREYVDDGRSGKLVRVHDGLIKMVHMSA